MRGGVCDDPFQPTFSFVKAGQLAFQIKGADIASVKAKIDELK